ncbi:hypothetical protein LTS02_003217 [Friedmanniomyces endolithicus]|nr:hypothetical protein LTS02_003217 [Friedmanniomyces endolithicus]
MACPTCAAVQSSDLSSNLPTDAVGSGVGHSSKWLLRGSKEASPTLTGDPARIASSTYLTRLRKIVRNGSQTICDCPAARHDATSPDRLWTSILDWMAAQGVYDMRKVMCWGLSAGGHNAVRAAHTHAKRFCGAVGQGAGTHHFFSRAWLEKAKDHEYPWTALPALTEKFGYKSEEEFLENAQKDFSLVDLKIVDMPATRVLLVNGTHDGLMPVEDSMLMMEYGTPKEGRFFTGMLHMGYPPANGCVYPWMEAVMRAAGT